MCINTRQLYNLNIHEKIEKQGREFPLQNPSLFSWYQSKASDYRSIHFFNQIFSIMVNTNIEGDGSKKTEQSSIKMVEANHPYFLTSSDSLGMNLININFDGTTYGNWRKGVLISLSAKNKFGFINGTCKKPKEDAPLFEQWRRCNDMVLAWLLNSLSREIAESVIYSQTAEDLWNELEQRYRQTDGAKMFQLQRELNNISQGTNDVAGYFNRLKKIWDQTKVTNTFMICSCDCSCGAKTHNVKMNEDQ